MVSILGHTPTQDLWEDHCGAYFTKNMVWRTDVSTLQTWNNSNHGLHVNLVIVEERKPILTWWQPGCHIWPTEPAVLYSLSSPSWRRCASLFWFVSRATWNPKQPDVYGCFNWMIPNLYLGNGCFTKHPSINGCLEFQESASKREVLFAFFVSRRQRIRRLNRNVLPDSLGRLGTWSFLGREEKTPFFKMFIPRTIQSSPRNYHVAPLRALDKQRNNNPSARWSAVATADTLKTKCN